MSERLSQATVCDDAGLTDGARMASILCQRDNMWTCVRRSTSRSLGKSCLSHSVKKDEVRSVQGGLWRIQLD